MALGLQNATRFAGAIVLAGLAVALALNVVTRFIGAPLAGANLFAAWLLPMLAFLALPELLSSRRAARGWPSDVVSGFAIGGLGLGMAGAALAIGGTEPVLHVPLGARFAVGAALCAITLMCAGGARRRQLVAVWAGAALSLLPLPAQPAVVGFGAFLAFLAIKTPVALALIAAVALAPGPLSDAALAQSVMRGLSGYVLLAVPLFIFAAGLLVAGGVGARIVAAVSAVARGRPTALGEANIVASLLFGGVSASSIADAATQARLLVPGMVAAGYAPSKAAAITAAASVLPNVIPPSIALLLAAAATNLSVGALWLAGALAAPLLAGALFLMVRLSPPSGPLPERSASAGTGRASVRALLEVAGLAFAILGALRFGLVTAVEAGLIAVVLSGVFAARSGGLASLWTALGAAARQSGQVALLIAAAAPVGFLLATSGLEFTEILPAGPPALTLMAALLLCLCLGTILDAGAAILLILPFLVPAVASAGIAPIHAALTLTIALLLGGLTPPVGILILVTKDVTGAEGVYAAVVPYGLALLGALVLIALVPLAFA